MKIYLYIDNNELEEQAESIEQKVTEWLEANPGKSRWINRPAEVVDKVKLQRVGDWDMGLVIETGKKADLKEPLSFLYAIAKDHELDFVVGTYHEETGDSENICYFGFEEGKPDLFEIANYLGMKR